MTAPRHIVDVRITRRPGEDPVRTARSLCGVRVHWRQDPRARPCQRCAALAHRETWVRVEHGALLTVAVGRTATGDLVDLTIETPPPSAPWAAALAVQILRRVQLGDDLEVVLSDLPADPTLAEVARAILAAVSDS